MHTFPIYHPEHGEAVADDATDMVAFEAAGWSKTKPEAVKPEDEKHGKKLKG